MTRRDPKRCLRAWWGRDPEDRRAGKQLIVDYPTRKADAALVCHLFTTHVWPGEHSFVKELERRGFDLTTLRFSVQLKEPTND